MNQMTSMSEFSVLPMRDQLSVKQGRIYIDEKWSGASDGATMAHLHPATNETVAEFAVGSNDDVDRAVRAARKAFESGPWPRMKARDRRRLVQRIAALMAEHAVELGQVQTLDNGMPINDSIAGPASSDVSAEIFEYYAGWVDKLSGEVPPQYAGEGDQQFLTVREPVGVVAAITPWNVPIRMFAQKVAPALATGCTVVVKPSEYGSLSIIRLMEILEQAGLPPGVLNLVTGGPATGEALARHAGVDKVTFTGSRAVGERLLALSGSGIKRMTLELGGKSPALVFADTASVKAAATALMARCSMGMSGQVCSTTTRALVHNSVYDEFLHHAQEQTRAVRFGNPFDKNTTSAAIINKRQLEKIVGAVARGAEEGARLVTGGGRQGGALARGNFIAPALFADADNKMSVAQEEIFGPVLTVLRFKDEEEAIRIANDTSYGLSSAVYTANSTRAFRVARALRAGSVGVNGYGVAPNAPLGGFKSSGLGRELGKAGIEAFTEPKTIILTLVS